MEAPISGRGNPQRLLSVPAHSLTWREVVGELASNDQDGLTTSEAKERLTSIGRNELDDDSGVDVVGILVGQVANAMTMVSNRVCVLPTEDFVDSQSLTNKTLQILILAMAVSFGIGAYIEGGVVAFVIALNISIGAWQEFSAQRVVANLRTLSAPTASVVRDGESCVVPSHELVPGDLIEIKMGDTLPADVRLVAYLHSCASKQKKTKMLT